MCIELIYFRFTSLLNRMNGDNRLSTIDWEFDYTLSVLRLRFPARLDHR